MTEMKETARGFEFIVNERGGSLVIHEPHARCTSQQDLEAVWK